MPAQKYNRKRRFQIGVMAIIWLACAGLQPATAPHPKISCNGKAAIPLGFSPRSYTTEGHWEQSYVSVPDPIQCGRYLRQLTAEPHVAGTPGDRRVADFIYEEFKRDGLNPEVVEYRVLLSYPKSVAVELSSPSRVKLANPEPEIAHDKDTRVSDPVARMPWNGYSPPANFTRPVVYANYGNAEDYDTLERLGVSVKDRIVLVRYFRGYRGGKSLEAEKRGAAGVIVYSDPADDGDKKGKIYPKGPWGPARHFQRGAVVYDFLTPGDPLTPGWASTDSARRIPESEARILPKIPMVPLSAADAKEILKRLRGPTAPKSWQGGLHFTYHAGDGNAKVHLALRMENRVSPIWDVIGKISGSVEPEKMVILGNHHDAWVYGAVDPSSGTATMLETARALGQLLKEGFRPRRTILLGSWDAEEYTLTGSTEWGEQHEEELKKNAVICLNVDASTSGRNFTVSMVPALLPALVEATQAVRDPATGQSVYDRWKAQPSAGNIRSYAVPSAAGEPVPFGVLGGGSDFMVFLQHNGVPSLDMIFDGPYGVYHSLYDDYNWMARFGDPGFRYHATMSRLWGLLALRFADADLLPLDYSVYAKEVSAYLESLEKICPTDFFATQIRPLIDKGRRWQDAAARVTARLESLRGRVLSGLLDPAAPPPAVRKGSAFPSVRVEESKIYYVPAPEGRRPSAPQAAEPALSGELAHINAMLMAEERALLDDEGLPGRPWFRHLVYAPLPSYEAETLPGLREAILGRDLEGARKQAEKLGKALDRAIKGSGE